MNVIVDTCIWSLALRKTSKNKLAPEAEELLRLIEDNRVQIIGPIRQEILSGIREKRQFNKLRGHLNSFPDIPIETADYVLAADYFNQCRSKGIQGSNTDFLICAVSVRNKCSIYTNDGDFKHFSKQFPIVLHNPG